jgi:hypothetical protein
MISFNIFEIDQNNYLVCCITMQENPGAKYESHIRSLKASKDKNGRF